MDTPQAIHYEKRPLERTSGDRLRSERLEPEAMMASAIDPACLRGVRAIIVEDSFVVAHSLEWLLTTHAGEVVGKAGSVASGLELARRTDYDVAILDIRLGDDLVNDVARVVHERGARIVYLTGYSDAGLLAADLRGYPVLAKPVQREALLDALLAT